MKKSARSVTKTVANGYASMGEIRRFSPFADDDRPLPLQLGWIRGKSRIVDDQVVLDRAGRSLYRPEAEKEPILLEFVNLDPKDPKQITDFVGRFGLLSQEGLWDSEEPLQEWIDDHKAISGWLNLYYWINRAQKDNEGTPEAFHHFAIIAEAEYRSAKEQLHHQNDLDVTDRNILFRAVAIRRFVELYEKGTFGGVTDLAFNQEQKAQLLRLATNLLTDPLSDSLREGVYYGILCDSLLLPKSKALPVRHAIGMNFQAIDLYHYLCLQLSFLLVDNGPIGLCSCGRYFVLTRSDRIHCTDECGGSKRKTALRSQKK